MARECTFCRPHEFIERVIHDDRQRSVTSFLSNPAMTDFHTLIIPRRHIEPGSDVLTEQEILDMKFEEDRLRDIFVNLGFRGIDSFQKTRPDVAEGHNGTKMNHFHTHVLPSNPGSELYETGVIWGNPTSFQLVGPDTIRKNIDAMLVIEEGLM